MVKYEMRRLRRINLVKKAPVLVSLPKFAVHIPLLRVRKKYARGFVASQKRAVLAASCLMSYLPGSWPPTNEPLRTSTHRKKEIIGTLNYTSILCVQHLLVFVPTVAAVSTANTLLVATRAASHRSPHKLRRI